MEKNTQRFLGCEERPEKEVVMNVEHFFRCELASHQSVSLSLAVVVVFLCETPAIFLHLARLIN